MRLPAPGTHSHWRWNMANSTIDPRDIRSAAEIPPPGSQFQGTSPRRLVDAYYGTVDGDVDAPPAARELLAPAPDTGGLANADYIYTQLARLYNADLPAVQSPTGNDVKSVAFVSGSLRGPYGAFHIASSQ